jgi:photosystem II stability/assembly factor-like uncharacterized protein
MKKYIAVIVGLLWVNFCSQAQWIVQHDSLPPSVNPDIQFSAVNANVCWGIKYTDEQLVYIRTTNGGANWNTTTLYTPLGGSCITAIDANTAWVAMHDTSGMSSGGVFKTTNGGMDWEPQPTAFPGSGGYPDDIHFFDPNNGVAIGDPHGGNWEIYTTTNGGTLWTRVPSSSIPLPLSGEFSADGLYASAGNSVWFGTVAGGNNGVYRSTDRGRTWSVTRNLPGNVGFGVAFKDSLNGLAYSCFGPLGNRISRTTDGGTTWARLDSASIPSTPSTHYISYVPGTRGSYVMTSHNNIGFPEPTIPGSAYSLDDGVHWTQVDPDPHGKAAFVSPTVGWSAGPSDAVYKWAGPSLPVSETGVELRSRFELHQNYPNPFNPSTRIKFQVPSSKFVCLKVFDVLGREVRALVNEELKAGSYETTFDGRGLTSGAYFYRLEAGEFLSTKRLLLLK